ncbi:tyrosine-protein phosphatase [Gorillibacterium sp. sgz500922]|uniref:tyrosine-protein phosphatase n=1 Tax=Gorillibacterium sp. sgz500922 TaxID=3446694 RepID=UPI003F664C6E
MIDIHTHILPALDDGAADLAEALGMARMAAAEGIDIVIATPHHRNSRYTNEADSVQEAVSKLQEQIDAHDIPLKLRTGQEIHGYSELLKDWDEGRLLTLADSPYLLLEFPAGEVPRHAKEWIYELGVTGITAVIAHPERNKELAGNMHKLAELIEAGALTQVTSHSLTGAFGRSIQKISMQMGRNRMIHFVASDAHNLQTRPFALREAYRLLAKEAGQEAADLCQRNASLLLTRQPISPPEIRVAKKRFFFFT